MKTRPFHVFVLTALLLSLLGSGLTVTPARAASIVVNGNTDQGGLAMLTDGVCSLREAIANANTDSLQYPDCLAGSGTDTITFAGNYTITLQQGEFLITSPIIINGNGASNTIIQANATTHSRIFTVSSAGNLTVDNLKVQNGYCFSGVCTNSGYTGANGSVGGAIYNIGGTLTVIDSVFATNVANSGGALYNTGTLTISNSLLDSNSSYTAGGAGGGIYNASGTVIMTDSLVTSNVSLNGGGIFNNQGSLTVANSTLYNNAAADTGGGVYNVGTGGTATLTNATISGNSASSFGGGIANAVSGTLNYTNTIIANSTGGGDCINSATIGTNVKNLVEDGGCLAAFSGDPMLGALANNGGATQTFALLTGSPAINMGNDATCSAAAGSPTYGAGGVDQRGVARPQGKHCDIGAFELVDTTAPDTAISTKPAGTTTSKSASLSFTGTDADSGVASYQCKLDAGAYAACVSPKAYSRLNLGSHTFSVRAIDRVGNIDTTPATFSWWIWTHRALNGGFNMYPTKTAMIPSKWVAGKFSATDGKDTATKKEGAASVMITNTSAAIKTLTQTLSTLAGAKGDPFRLSYWVKGNALPTSGLCQAQVLFYNVNTPVGTKTLACGLTGTFGFTQKTLTFTAPAAYTKVLIKFTYSKASGTVWFDLVSLLK